jgi:ABC-type lipoprotein export system ATPase subunit
MTAVAMKIAQVKLQRFSVFEQAELALCDGINVFIGTNGTGKSHLMKAMYCLLKASERAPQHTDNIALRYEVLLLDKLAKVFRPKDDSVGRLVTRALGRGKGSVLLQFTDDSSLQFQISTLGKLTAQRSEGAAGAAKSLFVPSREVLSLQTSLISAYEAVNLRFDETYYDLAKALAAPTLRGQRGEQAAHLVEPLEAVIGGKVHEEEDGSLHVRTAKGDFEPHLLSEGFRKLASLCRLILNGSLMANGFLFWDEPEANLNPEQVVLVARMLRVLAHNGVQVFLATHDSILSSELGLAADYADQMADPERCSLRFFGLDRSAAGQVTVTGEDRLAELPHNAILDAYLRHYDRRSELFAKAR